MSARLLREGPWANRALVLLYDLNERIACARGPQDGAEGVLDILLSGTGAKRGAVGVAHPPGEVEVLSARGVTPEVFLRDCRRGGAAFTRLLLSGRGTVILPRSGAAVTTGDPGAPPPPETPMNREGVSFFCAPVPSRGAAVPFVAVDLLFPGEAAPEEEAFFLATAASLLSPLFPGDSPGRTGPPSPGETAASLGNTLRRQIRSWIEPMENTRRLRSDVYERLMGEVEKILISAALEKTGYVQTEAALFLGINRNTLAKKIRQYGLGKKGGMVQ